MSKKKVLILGGTMFTGRALTEKLLASDIHDVTLFNRGKSNNGLFADVKQLHGNRETDDIAQVSALDWDVVIDFSGYYPQTFAKLIAQWRGNVGRYIFISTISVFDMEVAAQKVIAETDATLSCTIEQQVSALPNAYGEKKAAMERTLLQQEEMEVIILRPSFIYGRYDYTDRFYYWLYCTKKDNKVLMPQPFNLSLTYVEDLAAAVYNAIDAPHKQQVYNTISYTGISLSDIVMQTSLLLNKQVEIVPATDQLLTQHNISLQQFPLHVPFNLAIQGTQWLTDFGVAQTSFTDTLQATIEYHNLLNWQVPKVGLTEEQQQSILATIA